MVRINISYVGPLICLEVSAVTQIYFLKCRCSMKGYLKSQPLEATVAMSCKDLSETKSVLRCRHTP